MEYLLGIDVGSSSVKAAILDANSGTCAGSAFYPKEEQIITAPKAGFAEQDPQIWYSAACDAVKDALHESSAKPEDIKAIGVAYQMHGLVCVDSNLEILRPSIIWCDSRAISYGENAFHSIGKEECLGRMMNSPGNFTASKLAWVKEYEPEIYKRIYKIMLPGDWLAMKLSGKINTTVSGLSEGILWDFKDEAPSSLVMSHFGFDKNFLPDVTATFGIQGELSNEAAKDLNLRAGIPISYRAGDQPNNALSLNVLQPGEIAATAGTSGVVYGVTDQKKFDPKSRVNTFAHVTHKEESPRLGVLLCINGTGILNAWTKRLLGDCSYLEMNNLANKAPLGSDSLLVLPFGNGAERVLENRNIGAQIIGLDLNRHDRAHICRAVQEGIVFSFMYGMEIMKDTGINLKKIRAGDGNMFMSDIFCSSLANVSNVEIELYDTDGALGAARGAGVGAGIFNSLEDAFKTLEKKKVIQPDGRDLSFAYNEWKDALEKWI